MKVLNDVKIGYIVQCVVIIFAAGSFYATMSIKNELKTDIADSRIEFKQEIGDVKQDLGGLKRDIGYLQGRIDGLKS